MRNAAPVYEHPFGFWLLTRYEDVAGRGRVALRAALASPLPFSVIAEMLGPPAADHGGIRRLSGTVVRSREPVGAPEVVSAIRAADGELPQIAGEMIAGKRANPA